MVAVAKESQLQKELKQSKPFKSATEEAVVALFRTADMVQRATAEAVEPHGITLQQYNVLRILRGAGKEGLPTLAIVDRLIEQAPGITRFIDQLEKRGLVSRRRSAEDRRKVFCFLTSAGRKLVNAVDKPLGKHNEECLGVLTTAEKRALIRYLDKIRTGILQRDERSDS